MANLTGAGGYSSRPLHYPTMSDKVTVTITNSCWVEGEKKKAGESVEVSPVVASTLLGSNKATKKKVAKKKTAKPANG